LIFQSFNLLPVLSVDENVEYPLILQDVRKVERKRRVSDMINDVGLMAFRQHRPDQLSGRQRQRVAIARALITELHLFLPLMTPTSTTLRSV